MKKSTVLFLTAAFAIGLAAAFFFFREPRVEPPATVPGPRVEQPPAAEEQPAPMVRLPVAPPPVESAVSPTPAELPVLEKSDPEMRDALGTVLPEKKWLEMFIFDHLIRRFVLMVDSLPRPDLSYTRLPLYTPLKRFIPSEKNGNLTISPENYQRYTPFVDLVEKAGITEAAGIYQRYYPLFQEAYRELGYPHGRFNDRFIEVIDHLLATPEVKYPVRLVQPHIRYRYADPKLEALSAGQKLLIRMGPENSAIILAKLRELRPLLVNSAQAGN